MLDFLGGGYSLEGVEHFSNNRALEVGQLTHPTLHCYVGGGRGLLLPSG